MLRDIRVVLARMRQEPELSGDMALVRKYVIRTIAWMILSEFSQVIQVYPVKFFMNEIVKPDRSVSRLIIIAGSFVLLYGIDTEVYRRMDWHRNSAGLGAWRAWWGFGHRCILRQSTDWHVRNGTGEKQSLVSRNVSRVERLFDEAIFTTLPITLRVVITTGLMFVLGWQFGLIAVATLLAYATSMFLTERGIEPLGTAFQKDMKRAEKVGDELSRNWRTIRSLGMEEAFADDNEKLLRKIWQDDIPRHQVYLKYLLRNQQVLTLSRGIFYAGIVLIFASGGSLSIGAVVLAATWMEQTYSNLNRYQDLQERLKVGKQALKDLVEFMQLLPTIQNPAEPVWPLKPQGKVEFRNVGFGYENADGRAIDGLSLSIEPFTTTALVGPSGCGKSTLIKLLMRDYDPSEGQILVDDIDLRQFDHARYRQEMVGLVDQTIELFDRSIGENIQLGKPGACRGQVMDAAIAADAHQFIAKLPDGYDAQNGENGIRLSGGQRQRVAIARSLIRQPPILALDEATSSLDALSQAQVQKSINQLIARHTCTIFIIAHRLSTVMNADQVVVMEEGKIMAIGTHEELQRRNGLYKRLCELELEKGILDNEATDE